MRCAKLLCLAQQRGLVIDDVDCSTCGLPFVNDEENMKPTTKHVCTNCGTTTRGSVLGVCNPLKSFVLNAGVANAFGDLEVAELDDVVDCVVKNGGTITKTDITTFIDDNTPTVVSTAGVSTCVAPCAKTPKRVKHTKNSVSGYVQ